MTDEEFELMKKTVVIGYYDVNPENELTCPKCGRTAKIKDYIDEVDDSGYVMEYWCRNCHCMAAVMGGPTQSEVKKKAAEGNKQAQDDMWMVDLIEKRADIFEQTKLRSLEQLPDVPGLNLEFIWDFISTNQGDFIQIRVGETEIWREIAFFECVWRFNEVKDILKKKYGKQFRRLTPTERSKTWLFGDSLKSLDEIEYE